jgi:ubiquinone/menaquinone biosynthesis C-methylase UbiE
MGLQERDPSLGHRARPTGDRAARRGGTHAGDVIDVGCGTGENAVYLASRGLTVVGLDAAPTAIARAQEKARQRSSSAAFLVADALALEGLGRTFDAAIDPASFTPSPTPIASASSGASTER